MKLILTAAVENLGVAGDIVEVKDGYGRNYLLPRGLAIVATRGAEKQIEGIKRAQEARAIRDLDHAREVKAQLEALEGVKVSVRTSEKGKIFGSVSPDLLRRKHLYLFSHQFQRPGRHLPSHSLPQIFGLNNSKIAKLSTGAVNKPVYGQWNTVEGCG